MQDARDLARLRWRCRRGMLELQDPELFGYLVGRTIPAEAPLRNVVARIRNDP